MMSYRQGDHAERLAEFILGSFAFTTPIPRSEDIGHDFHCVLAEQDASGRFLRAGPSFSVQVRSKLKPLEFNRLYESKWAAEQANPFFYAVVTRSTLTLDLYSTWNRMNAFTHYGPEWPTTFQPNEEFRLPFLTNGRLQVPLGEPILRLTAREATEAKVDWAADVMRPWIQLDRRNIVNNESGMHWVEGPPTWTTNAVPPPSTYTRFYWNSKNLRDCIDNFGRTAVALRNTIANYREERKDVEFDEGIPDIDRAFFRYAPYMTSSITGCYDPRDESRIS
jgi:hypothetical protein